MYNNNIGFDGFTFIYAHLLMRDDKVSVWELRSDRILYSFPGVLPSVISSDGRVLIYCTNDNEIVVCDLVTNKELSRLQGHTAPIVYLAMSDDREFIASYSIDLSIKIWGRINNVP